MRATASATLRPEWNIDAVGALDVAHDLGAEAAALEADEIEAVQRGAVAGGVAERRHVLRDHGTGAEDSRFADLHKLMDADERADDARSPRSSRGPPSCAPLATMLWLPSWQSWAMWL